MISIYFVCSCPPILCGIGSYLKSLLKEIPKNKWKAISFDLKNFQLSKGRLTSEKKENPKQVWYGIANRRAPSAAEILEGIKKFAKKNGKYILWFEHSFGMWKNSYNFGKMIQELSDLKIKKIISFHTIHFQSKETPRGMEKKEYKLLKNILPYVEAVTVFSRGACQAVRRAFPEYQKRIYILRHGISHYPKIVKMSKKEARKKLFNFLIKKTNLPKKKKIELKKENSFFVSGTFIMGSVGFITPTKNIESLFSTRDSLQRIIPEKKVRAIHIGTIREKRKGFLNYHQKLQKMRNGINKFYLDIWLPDEMLPICQKAFDINYYWPRKCTQSGITPQALGVGGIIAGRNMEGSGEILKEAGQIIEEDSQKLLLRIKKIALNQKLRGKMEKKALKYVKQFSWRNQALKHYKLAERVYSQ